MIAMSTHPHADRLRHVYRALDGGDMEPLLDLLRSDIEWVDSTLGPLAGTYTGKAEVPEFFGKMMAVYGGGLHVEILDVLADDGHGIVLTRESGTVGTRLVAWTSVHVWFFTDGHCHQFINYGSAEYQRFWVDELAGAGN
jgi:ketosteroid isomerase-like protein